MFSELKLVLPIIDLQQNEWYVFNKRRIYGWHECALSMSFLTYVYFQKDGQIENLIPMLMPNKRLDPNEAMEVSYVIAQTEAKWFCVARSCLEVPLPMFPRPDRLAYCWLS